MDSNVIAKYPQYQQFMDEYVAFSKAYAESLATGFKGQYSVMQNNFSPSANYVGDPSVVGGVRFKSPPANSKLNTSKEEEVCKEIGFKPNTEPFADCVLKLIAKKSK